MKHTLKNTLNYQMNFLQHELYFSKRFIYFYQRVLLIQLFLKNKIDVIITKIFKKNIYNNIMSIIYVTDVNIFIEKTYSSNMSNKKERKYAIKKLINTNIKVSKIYINIIRVIE